MNDASTIEPANRQVLVNLGNRFVVFGSDGGFPTPVRFDPVQSPILPRVEDEGDIAEARIAETLQVFGMSRQALGSSISSNGDVELIGETGERILVDIKVREQDPKRRDIAVALDNLHLARSRGEKQEVWFFNIGRLRLTVMWLDGGELRFDDLVPLNVWEKTEDGIIERCHIVEEVEDWHNRLTALYAQVKAWLADHGHISFDQLRTVTMSEEPMREFAVSDRELPVLDVLQSDQVIASLVPRGLWLIGAWGRVDIITKDKTLTVVAKKRDNGEFEWVLISPEGVRQTVAFDKSILLELLGGL